jgi:L-iditol 2-dehydrogenase
MSDVPTTMRASVLIGKQAIAVEERAVPVPDADQVLVRVGSVGVCGSDVHFYTDGALGDWQLDGPLVLGHESGGTIVAAGRAVDSSRVGERVSIEPQRPSSTSEETLSGRYNLDPHMQFYAVPGVDGAFQEYVVIQAHFAHPVPGTVSDDAAGLMEPLSVAVATARKAEFTVGSRVLISGAGPIGVVTAQVARAFGASEVLVTDIDPERRERALQFGATDVLDPIGDAVGRAGLRVDAFVEASGAAAAVATGIREVRPAGTVVLVGMGPQEVSVPVPAIQNNELRVTGVFRYANTWPTAIELVRSGCVDLDGMVTGHFGLGQVEEALRSTAEPQTLKSVVRPNG